MALYTRKDSPYWWLDLVAPDGRRIQRSTHIRHDAPTPALRREARRMAERVEAEWYLKLASGDEAFEKPRITFAAYAEWYRTHVIAHHRGARNEGYILRQLTRHFGSRRLDQITPAAIREWITLRRQQVHPLTVNRGLTVLKRMLTLAVPTYLNTSPAARIPFLRADQRPIVVLSRDDEPRLLDALPFRDRVLVIAAIDTLARANELLALRWTDDCQTHLTIWRSKTGRSRKVPISSRLRRALDELRAQTGGTGYIFAHRRRSSERNTVLYLRRMLRRACRKAGLPYGRAQQGLTFHSLRHTGATRLIEAGVSVRIVQEIGGWTTLQMLQRYTHPSEEAIRRAVELIATLRPT